MVAPWTADVRLAINCGQEANSEMRLMEEMTQEKLRGGYYTPKFLVEACYERLVELLGPRDSVRLLDSSAGDGAFVRHLPARLAGAREAWHFTGIEIVADEARKCRECLELRGLNGHVQCDSFFSWSLQSGQKFDGIVGNPPFVRYQFVPPHVRSDADTLLNRAGQAFDGVSNLWIPFFLTSVNGLSPAGALALVLPSELLTTKSAGVVRHVLVRDLKDVTLDLYPRGSFPDILQDVIVVSGRKADPADERSVEFVDHSSAESRRWRHNISAAKNSWTRFLLTEDEKNSLDWFATQPTVVPLGKVARLRVAIVTGANGFFTVGDATVEKYELRAWVRPLMPKTADCPGLVFTEDDHERTVRRGRRAWLLDFSSDRPNPLDHPLAALYLQEGELQHLHQRFKCRIREPWHRVPGIVAGELMMTKRSHQYHRLLVNHAGVFTTDTVYRGNLKQPFRQRMADLVVGFHNSGTLLSAEIEGRNYGGGVLELVPSEIQRVLVPLMDIGKHLRRLDALSRNSGGQRARNDALVSATNELLCTVEPDLEKLLPTLEAARQRLRNWRFEREG